MKKAFKELFATGFQPPAIPDSPPRWLRANVFAKDSTDRRLLLVVDNFVPSLANPLLGLVPFLQRAGYAVTLVVLQGTPPPQLYITSDIFFLASFLPQSNFAPFVYYLTHSRSFDALLFVGSVPSFLVSIVRFASPHAKAVRYAPLGSATPPADLPLVREAAHSASESPLMALSEWSESAAARLFQRQNFLLHTGAPLILLPTGASLAAANETATILGRLEADARLTATVVLLRDRLSSLEPWTSVHPLFRWGVRNSTTSSVRVLVVSAYEQDTYRAWLRAADGLLLLDGSASDVTLAWHRAALNGGLLMLGPSVQYPGLPQSIVRSATLEECYDRVAEVLQTGGASYKKATAEEAAQYKPRPLEDLMARLHGLSFAPLPPAAHSFATESEMYAWAEQQAREVGWV